MQYRFEEYFVKVILENCFPDKLVGLTVNDKPDLWNKNKIGIEVTNCMPQEVVEQIHLWHRISKNGTKNQERIIGRLKQLGMEYSESSFVWDQGHYSSNIDESPIKYFLDAVEKKVKKLNNDNSHYMSMESYELFVNSFIFIPPKQMGEVMARLKTINSQLKKFDIIYLLTNEQKLLIFDMQEFTWKVLYLYNRLDFWAKQAQQICIGEKGKSNS